MTSCPCVVKVSRGVHYVETWKTKFFHRHSIPKAPHKIQYIRRYMAKMIYYKDLLISNSDLVWILEETNRGKKMFFPFLFVAVILTISKISFSLWTVFFFDNFSSPCPIFKNISSIFFRLTCQAFRPRLVGP
jgi:hypothetical protein